MYEALWRRPAVAERRPTLDCFADVHNARVPGAFNSGVWNPGCLGVDAFAQDWSPPAGPTRPLLYVNPLFSQAGRVLAKVLAKRPDCVLILPVWPRWWQALLRRLPVAD